MKLVLFWAGLLAYLGIYTGEGLWAYILFVFAFSGLTACFLGDFYE